MTEQPKSELDLAIESLQQYLKNDELHYDYINFQIIADAAQAHSRSLKAPRDEDRERALEILEEAARPLMKYLSDTHNPHTKVIVTSTNAEVVGGILSFYTENYIKD